MSSSSMSPLRALALQKGTKRNREEIEEGRASDGSAVTDRHQKRQKVTWTSDTNFNDAWEFVEKNNQDFAEKNKRAFQKALLSANINHLNGIISSVKLPFFIKKMSSTEIEAAKHHFFKNFINSERKALIDFLIAYSAEILSSKRPSNSHSGRPVWRRGPEWLEHAEIMFEILYKFSPKLIDSISQRTTNKDMKIILGEKIKSITSSSEKKLLFKTI